jgi:hypothetical protein
LKTPKEILEQIAPLYEEYNTAPDPFLPSVKQAKVVFDSECRKLYQNESVEFRKQMTFDDYVATVVVQDINDYLRPKKKFPSV